MCYVFVPTSHKKFNHYVLQTCSNKNLKKNSNEQYMQYLWDTFKRPNELTTEID